MTGSKASSERCWLTPAWRRRRQNSCTVTPLDVVRDLLDRLDLRGDGSAVVSFDEVATWPTGLVDALEAAGLLRRGPPLEVFECPECLEPHSERVTYPDASDIDQ